MPSLAFFLLAIATLSHHSLGSALCPASCRCLWKSSKMTVECGCAGATAIPDNMDIGTQVLNMSHNSLGSLTMDMFFKAGLMNLQKLNVGHNNISSLHSRTFSGLLNLVEVDLSQNSLASVPSHAFTLSRSLMILNLAFNPITEVRSDAFGHLRQLTKLDLSYCQISILQSGAFHNLGSLERLYLEGNRLRVVSDVRQLGSGLHGISLHDNPWHCDCDLRPFRDWLVQTNVPRLYEPTCHTPHRLQSFKITQVSVTEFACLPSVSPTAMFLTVREGRNVSLVCRVQSDPRAEISWSYNGLLIDRGHPRIRAREQYEGRLGGTRSELVITNTTAQENGSFLCVAENKAGRAMANFSLVVEPGRGDTLVMEMRMEHFIAISACVITILILLMVIVTILLIKIARKHYDSTRDQKDAKTNSSPYKASSMPRSIQMGTGHVSHVSTVKTRAPDILSGVSQSQSSSDGSMVSMETVLTPATSDLSEMRDIIKDLGEGHSQPLIGHTGANQSPWSIDNPYLHTSGPPPGYMVYRQRLPCVRADEQYPILQYHHHQQSALSALPNIQYGHQAPSDNPMVQRKQNPDYISNNKESEEKYSNGKVLTLNESDFRNEKLSLKLQVDKSEVSTNEEKCDEEIAGINQDMETVLQRMVNTCWSEGTKI